ncbi:hypothetical protein GSI_14730 [Ganoderma sinense ZZ0214-1]|uniref:BTB domain-containing protein n=1 Tax=Ganoderma sinense ZZ0214-1 TaxID=1077348 RepID=A0A2G8RPI1_9APHY|nr:hypothetical protein GSI_14730 [Ganoderma sinense ZZ0214-1]
MYNAEWDALFHHISDDFPSTSSEPLVSKMTGTTPLDIPRPVPTQFPTPPGSDEMAPSPLCFQEGFLQDDLASNINVSVSTTFHPHAALLPIPTDLIFLSADGVFFYVHTTQILASSTNHFNGLVPPIPSIPELCNDLGPIVPLPEPATTLNIVLHVVYRVSCANYRPSIDTLIAAIDLMAKYGLPPLRHIAPSTSLYRLVLGQAPMQPVAVYALAAAHDLHDLALPVSSHLLSFTFRALTDDLAIRIGPVYLKRLFFMHLGRLDALKRLLRPAPYPHSPTSTCGFRQQKKLAGAWMLASAALAWDARPDLSTSAIEEALLPLADHLPCSVCRRSLANRVRQLIIQWSLVKRSI